MSSLVGWLRKKVGRPECCADKCTAHVPWCPSIVVVAIPDRATNPDLYAAAIAKVRTALTIDKLAHVPALVR